LRSKKRNEDIRKELERNLDTISATNEKNWKILKMKNTRK